MSEAPGSSNRLLPEELEHAIFGIPHDFQLVPEDEWIGPVVEALSSVLDSSGTPEEWDSRVGEILGLLDTQAGGYDVGAVLKEKVLVALLKRKQSFVENSGQ